MNNSQSESQFIKEKLQISNEELDDNESENNQDQDDENKDQEEENLKDIVNPEIKQLIKERGLNMVSYEDLIVEKKEREKELNENRQKLKESQTRQWLIKHKKREFIDFDDKERSKLKQYFRSLDGDGSGSIGLRELEDPLISLGIAESKEDVKKIMDQVDKDHSNEIEFQEFLDIIKAKEKGNGRSQKNTAIINFFKDMINGQLGDGDIQTKNLPFQLIISTIRRKKLLDAIMSTNQEKKKEGEKVMKAYGKLLAINNAPKQSNKQNDSKQQSQRSSFSNKK
ncbi:hypothetical protein ABPG74_012679 [Tetrahymena malaccensis]